MANEATNGKDWRNREVDDQRLQSVKDNPDHCEQVAFCTNPTLEKLDLLATEPTNYDLCWPGNITLEDLRKHLTP